MRITYEAEVTQVTKTKYTDSGYRSEASWQSGRYSREAIVVPLRLELGAKVRVIVTDEPDEAGEGDDLKQLERGENDTTEAVGV